MISEDAIRAAHSFYTAVPTRSLEDAALEFGMSTGTLQKRLVDLGLPRKGVHDAKRGKPNANVANPADDAEPYSPPGARVVRPSVQRMQRRWR